MQKLSVCNYHMLVKDLPNGTEKYMLKPSHDMSSFVSKTYFFIKLFETWAKHMFLKPNMTYHDWVSTCTFGFHLGGFAPPCHNCITIILCMLVALLTKKLPNGTEKCMLKPGHDMPSFVSKHVFLKPNMTYHDRVSTCTFGFHLGGFSPPCD